MGVTPTARLQPPAEPVALVPRPRVARRLDDALGVPLTAVVAEAGFGKTVAVASWADDHHASWLTLSRGDAALTTLAGSLLDAVRLQVPGMAPTTLALADHLVGPGGDDDERAETYAVRLVEAMTDRTDRPMVVVLDGLDELGDGAPGVRLVEAMVRLAPRQLHLVVLSRSRLPFGVDRLRGRGRLVEVGPDLLRFDADETTGLLTALLGPGAAPIAADIHDATDGWPAAIRLAGEALRDVDEADWSRTVGRLRRSGTGLFAFLAGEVLSGQSPAARQLLRMVAPLPAFDAEVCERLGVPDAPATIDGLVRRGLVRHRPDDGGCTVPALVRACVEQVDPLLAAERADAVRTGARWLHEVGHSEAALDLLHGTGDVDLLAEILEQAHPLLLAAGRVEALTAAAEVLPPERRSADLDAAIGQALMVTGQWEESLACMQRVAADADTVPPMVAWRMGLIQHLRGNLDEALAAYTKADRSGDDPDEQVSLLLSMHASALWVRGEIEASRDAADEAMALARSSGDANALSAAHTAMAMLAAAEGDRRANDTHDRLALEYAEAAGNVLQVVRIRSNRGSHLVETGEYLLALDELDVAIDLAELTGFATFLALARSNRGQALAALGRIEEARAEFTASATVYDQLGSRLVVFPLLGLAELHRVRGEVAAARSAYERAMAAAEEIGDLQTLVPLRAGLARVVAGQDLDRATELAATALAAAEGLGAVPGRLGAGWVALQAGDVERAAALAAEAADAAQARRDPAGLAEARELAALSTDDRAACDRWLDQAIDEWDRIGASLDAIRGRLVRAVVAGDQAAAEAARSDLRLRGVRDGVTATAGSLGALAAGVVPLVPRSARPIDPSRLRIDALGAFRVFVDGDEVPLSAWQSRKARDLVKLLLVRRGRPVPREVLIDHLWPGESPQDVGGRLSAALSVARSVLDPDRTLPPDHYLVATPESVRLDLDHVQLDMEVFLRRAQAVEAAGGQVDAAAVDELAAIEATYGGDLLEDDPYEAWAIGAREECRAAHLAVLRRLVAAAGALGRTDEAVRYALRLLDQDPYDEAAHLDLVATLVHARRHGEAHRHYRGYTARMRELEIEPAAFPE